MPCGVPIAATIETLQLQLCNCGGANDTGLLIKANANSHIVYIYLPSGVVAGGAQLTAIVTEPVRVDGNTERVGGATGAQLPPAVGTADDRRVSSLQTLTATL